MSILIQINRHMDSTNESPMDLQLIGARLHSVARSKQPKETSGRPTSNSGKCMADDDGAGSKNGFTSLKQLPLWPFRPKDGLLSRQLRLLCCKLAASASNSAKVFNHHMDYVNLDMDRTSHGFYQVTNKPSPDRHKDTLNRKIQAARGDQREVYAQPWTTNWCC